MGHHTFDAEKAEKLEEAGRYRYLSAEELLWALDLSGEETVADLGSGTGFYTDDVAPSAEHIWGVDVQSAMHEQYREKGVPENVDLVTTDVADLPFDDDGLDAAFSTMTYHEFASDDSLAELARVVRPGGRLVIGDWAASGEGESGPPAAERYALDDAVTALENAGFAIEFEAVRPETFLVTATRSSQ
jgi:ubiquinone/menaquinone biosynthesis C-methylase UbiE